MNTLEVIRSLYPDEAEDVIEGANSLIEKYRNETANQQRLTERDAIMITYGDSFRDGSAPPLNGLERFANEHLGNSISAIHLLPCFPFTTDDGFSVVDYYQIDPALGDWGDIESLGESYDLMFDAVVNHISQKSDWFQGFLAGDPRYSEYFITCDPDADYSSVTRPRALPLIHAYSRGEETVNVWTTFSEDQVDLNFKSGRVFLNVLDVLLFYVSKGARYIRLDAIAFIWKELGTTCLHLDQAHQVIQLYRHFIDQIAPQVRIITETNVPHKENISYFGDGHNEAHLVYNFTLPPLLLHSLHQQNVETLTRWAANLELPSDDTCFFNFTASHDGVGVRPLQGIVSDDDINALAKIAEIHGGFVSMRDNGDGTQSPYEINCNYLDFATAPDQPDSLRAQRFLLTQSVMLTMPGVPGIYYHSLIGSQNDREAVADSEIYRRINRAKLELGPLAAELADTDSLRGEVFRRYKRMLDVRQNQSALSPYAPATYESSGSVFIIKRTSDEQSLWALHNFSDQTADVGGLPDGLKDLISGESLSDTTCTLQPFEYRWLS